MLLRFQFGNFRSFRDVQTLSWVASSVRHPSREVDFAALPVCAIYGANASGKSNVLAALGFFTSTIRRSFRQWSPSQAIPRSRFLGTSFNLGQPTSFVLDFRLEDAEYQYGFELDDAIVLKEWLWAFPQGRKQEWFRRETGSAMYFGPKLRGPNKTIEEVTRVNSLFMSAAAQNNHEQLLPIFSRLTRDIVVRANVFPRELNRVAEYINSPNRKTKVLHLIQAAELGISDLQIYEPTIRNFLLKHLGISGRDPQSRSTVRLTHQIEGQSVQLPEELESEGTKTFLAQLPAVLSALSSGGTLAIDEIDRSLHSILCIALIRLFMSKQTNPNSAQLLFTTHDSSLLSSGDLRRDEIWFTEKRDDGASVLYPLTDYSPRKQENLERGYLQGRYGAIPFSSQDQFLRALAKDTDEEDS